MVGSKKRAVVPEPTAVLVLDKLRVPPIPTLPVVVKVEMVAPPLRVCKAVQTLLLPKLRRISLPTKVIPEEAV